MSVSHSFFCFFLFPNLPMSKLKTLKVTLFVISYQSIRFDPQVFFSFLILKNHSPHKSFSYSPFDPLNESSDSLSKFVFVSSNHLSSLHLSSFLIWLEITASSFRSATIPTFHPKYFLLHLNHRLLPSLPPFDLSFNPNYFLFIVWSLLTPIS